MVPTGASLPWRLALHRHLDGLGTVCYRKVFGQQSITLEEEANEKEWKRNT